MTIAAMREKAHELLNEIEDDELPSIIARLERANSGTYEWSEDEEFVAELDERVRRYESGIDKGHTWAELEAEILERKKKRALNG